MNFCINAKKIRPMNDQIEASGGVGQSIDIMVLLKKNRHMIPINCGMALINIEIIVSININHW